MDRTETTKYMNYKHASHFLNKILSFSAMGPVPSPFDCFLANRGLKTLAVRMEQHQKNAIAVASFLENSPLVTKVKYPGLPSHPQYEITKKQVNCVLTKIRIHLAGLHDYFNRDRLSKMGKNKKEWLEKSDRKPAPIEVIICLFT